MERRRVCNMGCTCGPSIDPPRESERTATMRLSVCTLRQIAPAHSLSFARSSHLGRVCVGIGGSDPTFNCRPHTHAEARGLIRKKFKRTHGDVALNLRPFLTPRGHNRSEVRFWHGWFDVVATGDAKCLLARRCV
jgi:hypothetical protein